MTMMNRRRFLRHLAGSALVLAGATAGMEAEQVTAATKTTAANLIVRLSDGRQMQILLTIDATAAHVSRIVYTVHVPQGVRVTGVTYTGNALNGKERVQLVADLAPGAYSMDTVVTGLNRVFGVRSTTIMQRRPIMATGLSGAHLVARFAFS